MALNLKDIQAKLLAQQANKDRIKTGGGFGGDNAIYPFWNNPEGSSATMRFLPDGDETNDFFWLERLIIKLPFPGVKGDHTSKPVEVQVPCTDMWKANSCPVTAEIRPWWKDKSTEDLARKYYRKKSFLFQGFVPSNPNKDDQEPANPIRRFIINPSVFDVIKSILMDQDLENSPTDYDHGRDFSLIKTTKGGYANYASSKWSMKERALTTDERSAVNQHGLWNLSSFLPKKPDDAHLNAIMEMFAASVSEELYDVDKWGQFYRPNGMRADVAGGDSNSNDAATSRMPATSKVTGSSILNRLPTTTPVETDDANPPWDEHATSVTQSASTSADKPKMQTPDDIIAAIRRRQQQK